jgi:hypothetical protein
MASQKLLEQELQEAYEQIGYDDLITYVVYRLVAEQKETTFENIVAEAFTLFPKRFSLRGYPQWPDSAVINKSWLRCRTDKKLIVGSVKDGFKLTQRGLEVAEKVASQLKSETNTLTSLRLKSELRTRAGRLLRAIEQNPSYKQFTSTGSIEQISKNDIADVLLTLPDTPVKRLRSNLEQFKDAARLYQRDDILKFLEKLAAKLGAT